MNAAGITGPERAGGEYAVEDWRRVLAIDLDGTFLCCKHVVPMMKRAGYGRIVNVDSIAGKEGNPNAGGVFGVKGGVIALTKSLGKELSVRHPRQLRHTRDDRDRPLPSR